MRVVWFGVNTCAKVSTYVDNEWENRMQTQIAQLCEQRNTTLSRACRECGLNYGTLHSQLTNGRAIPFGTVDALSQHFDVPIEFFSSRKPLVGIYTKEGQSILHKRAAAAYTAALRSEQLEMMRQGYGVGTDQVLDWLHGQGGILENFDQLREHVDLFFPIESTDCLMRPARLGKMSLATQEFGLADVDHYAHVVGRFNRHLLDRVMAAHKATSSVKYSVTDETVKEEIDGQWVESHYRRVMARVYDVNGNPFTLVHARSI